MLLPMLVACGATPVDHEASNVVQEPSDNNYVAEVSPEEDAEITEDLLTEIPDNNKGVCVNLSELIAKKHNIKVEVAFETCKALKKALKKKECKVKKGKKKHD